VFQQTTFKGLTSLEGVMNPTTRLVTLLFVSTFDICKPKFSTSSWKPLMELNCNCDFRPICCHNSIIKNEEVSDGDSAYCIPVFGQVFDFALNPQWGV
jgi:hypothetical protein